MTELTHHEDRRTRRRPDNLGDTGTNGRDSDSRFLRERADIGARAAEVAAPEPEKQAPNRLKNGQFAPGTCGNPKGRPRGRTLRGEIRGVLDTIDLLGRDSVLTARTMVARTLVAMAMDGDMRAIALILASEPRLLAEEEPPPSVGPADTGRLDDVTNHFLATGQLPIDEADMPEFCTGVLAALHSEDTPEEVTHKLMVQVIETFGTLDGFGDAMKDCAHRRTE